jgi:GAF domain
MCFKYSVSACGIAANSRARYNKSHPLVQPETWKSESGKEHLDPGNRESTPVTCRKVAYSRRIGTERLKRTSMSSNVNQGFAAKPAKQTKATLGELESMISESPSTDRACLKLAQVLRVRRSEVALLRLEKGSLRFIFPPELRSAGVLPLSGSAVAARTASTRTPLLSNSFMRVKHVSLFEAVKLGAEEEDKSLEQMPIQKIMSVPILNSENVVGVVQISRKGLDPSISGADFTGEDLKQLEEAAKILGRMPFMKEGAEI